MATDTAKQWSIREDGCLSIDVNTHRITYNSSLNAVILTCKDQTVTVLDALSGAFLQKSDLSGDKKGKLECAYLPEKDRTVFCDGLALGVRGDLQGILLLDTALQTAIARTEDSVKIELPLAEATQLLKTLLSTELSNKNSIDDFENVLAQSIQKVQDATQGNHKTAKWATVTLQMQHLAIRSVCSALMEELTKSNQTGQGFPVASAIVDRLGFLLPSSRLDIMKEPVNRALMYSEAARRETFVNWPHMNYKWALPEPMAQAGFFHHPNLHGDDRAMCFTCNVCLVCWEPTDEPWSEHERHSQLCPYIKGDYTQNVPLTVTYATQPAQFHDDHAQQKITCLSSTFNEDFIATSTGSGNITVWDISYILKKHCQFDIDLGNALVALMTGLHIENSDSENLLTTPNCSGQNVDHSENIHEEKSIKDFYSIQNQYRPPQDLGVTSLCVADETKWRDEILSANPSKPAVNTSAQLSLICGVTLRCAKPPGMLKSRDSKGQKGIKNPTVQLMNEVNEAVSSDPVSISQLITDTDLSSKSDFLIPQGRLVPYIVVVSVVEDFSGSGESNSAKKKSSSPTLKPSTSKDDMAVSVGEQSNSSNFWAGPWEDGLDPDCQIVGFTPSPGKSTSGSLLGMMMEKHIQELQKTDVPNGPSDLCDSVDTIPDPSSPDKKFFFSDFTDASLATPAKAQSISSFHNMSGSSTTSGSSAPVTSEFPHKVPVKFDGTVIQCLEIPSVFQSEQIEVQSILPSADKQHVIIILSTKVGFLESTSSSGLVQDGSPSAIAADYCGGGVLVYRLRSENSRLVLEDEPVVVYQVTSPHDAITSSFLLPHEVEDQFEDGVRIHPTAENHGTPHVIGHLVVTTASGVLKVLSLANLSPVAELSPGPSEKYICATYCSGVERLCACTDNGKLKFFDMETVSNRHNSWANLDLTDGSLLNGEGSACKKAKMDEDVLDHTGTDYLINQPLNGDTLKQLHELIQFENLMPRFTAVVPPCWSEIQQEQQQRRHPQHLQQQGESTQHTRTWKLTTDTLGQTWDEHLFEILLPKPCSVGHVDLKFSLHPMCTLQPNIEVTLLKQNIGSIFSPPNKEVNLDDGKNSSKEPSTSEASGASVNCDNHQDSGETSVSNPVLNPDFQKTHNAEILCGPVKLSNCLDLTGSGGLITLSSPQLLSSKPRSLLLHIKGFENSPVSDPILINKEKAETDRSSTLDKKMKFKKKTLKGLFDSVAQGSADKNSASERQRLTDVKGCDWFQELSVTVRVFKKTNVKAEKQQRHLMIMDNGFHRRLIELVSPSIHCIIKGVNPDQMHCMALDILIWALTVQINDVEKRRCERPLLETIQSELKTMVKTCFILSSRTTAHKFSRLLAMCMESSKYSIDRDMAPAFSYAVMQALLACYPLLPHCSSSGALRWFFILLNRAKCMDVEMVAQKSCELLMQVSQHYSRRTHHLQALLKTRYGLYGNPFEAELFDLEHSSVTKPQAALSGTMPFTNGPKGSSSSGSGNSANNKDHTDLFDLLTSEKNFKTQPDCLRSDILGLLEVEPLHFRCHATSDGTRMERMDATTATHGPVTTSSTFNTGLSQLALQGFGVEEMPAGDITKYMAQANASKLVTPMPNFFLGNDVVLKKKPHLHASKMYGATKFSKPAHDISKTEAQKDKLHQQTKSAASKAFAFPQIQGLLQTPPPQVLVIERMHSGARRFVTLDFGKRIVLTDVIIPSSMDLASLSIDVWVEGEEVDGQRLVVASDIGHRTLVMNNIMPAPVCRYLKITTVGRYSGGTTRSRIPLGSFFGHTYILPWVSPNNSASNPSVSKAEGSQSSSAKSSVHAKARETGQEESVQPNSEGSASCEMPAHASLVSQLALFLSLQEDLQCRFNLARTRLEALLTVIGNAQFLSSHVQYHLKRNSSGKLNEEDAQIIQAYNECLQLQIQLNLAQHAIRRLQTSLGMNVDRIDESVSLDCLLEQTSTDKLRVILESLLDTLLTSTVGSPAIPQPPAALYTALTPQAAQNLFQHLCIHSPQRVQVSAGLLLVRVCGTQPWWGHFLGNIMQEFFHAHFSQVFPQDRVFLLLSAMGQKSLCGPSAGHILDSVLTMLTSILSPLTRPPPTDASTSTSRSLDLSLISWVLLFLCRNMDSSSSFSTNMEDEKNSKREKEGAGFNNRWGFIESQWSPSSGGSHGKSQRIYRRGIQKKVALYKQKFHELDKMKLLSGADKKNPINSKIMLKINALLLKLPNERAKGDSSHGGKDDDLDGEPLIVLSRERCLSVAQGLVSLLLSMDFTCHVDLFLITCKVLAKICVACRPSVSLAEAVTQEQLERLVLLVVNTEFNHSTMTWGGPWAAHSITCLLQDILEGKKSCSSSPDSSETELPDVEDSLIYSRWMEREGSMLCTEHIQDSRKVRIISHENVRTILRNKSEFHDFVKKDFLDGTFCLDEKDNPAALVLLFSNKNDKDKVGWKKFQEAVTKNQVKNVQQSKSGANSIQNLIMDCFSYPLPSDFSMENLMYNNTGPSSSLSASSDNLVDALKIAQSKGLQSGLKQLANLKNRLTEHMSAASGISLHLSTALDARLEFGLETMPEHRLKMMQSVQLGNVQCAFTLPLPPCPPGSVSFDDSQASSFPDEDVSQAGREESPNSSLEMLSICFEHMFARLRTGRVSLEAVLQLWLTLNEDHLPYEDRATASTATGAARVQLFDATRQPVIALSENAVASLMEVGVMMPVLMVRTWVFLLQSLCLLTNQRHTNSHGVEMSLAPAVLRDPNLAALLTKFLCSHPPGGSGSAGSQLYQVGPAAVKILGDLLHRLQCKSIEVNGQRFKEMLLKIVYNLIADRGAIYQCSGPIDAQVQFLEMMSESPLLSVDVSNALSVIQAASTLVYQHLSSQDQVVCHNSHDTALGAQSCFGGLVPSLLRGNDSRPGGTDSLRDQLMFFLLQLVNKLISAPMHSMIRSGSKSSGGDATSAGDNLGHKPLPRKPTWADPPIEGSRYTPRLLTNIRLSDDEKSRTRNQHLSDHQSQDQQVHNNGETDEDDEGPRTVSEIADIVASHPVIMQNLIQSLSHCSSNKLALMFAHTDCLTSLQKSVDHTEAVTVGDLIFTILRNLKEKCSDRNVMVDNLYHFFDEHPSLMSQQALTRLSEPLLFYTLRILNSTSAIKRFIDLGGINVVGSNLVRCSQQMISSSPSIVSTLMQNFSSSHIDLGDKNKGLEVDNTDGLQSFAQLGTITCSSPTAVPADGLVQPLANRRARSATWSYHFYPDEPCVELSIHLPFAVLLKYVHIRPHAAAISSCPSHVSLELSHDGNVVTPSSPPLLTSSLTLIRLQLQKPQVVTSVTLLLHRPLDSTTIGLQRISLWGQTAFAELAENTLSNEDGFSRSSLGWMRILHHCLLNSNDELQSAVAQIAASTPNLLSTCTSLLLHPVIGVHASKIETILNKLGLSHGEISLALLDNILRQPASPNNPYAPVVSYLGKIHGVASPHTVEIIYKLGTSQDENTQDRVSALLRWLADCARASLNSFHNSHTSGTSNRSFSMYSVGREDNTLCNPSPEHVQCVAAVLWHSVELPVAYPLHRLVNIDFIRLLYDWSGTLVECNLRKAVNNVLCSACHSCQNGFMHIQEWMGIVGPDGSQIIAPTPSDSGEQTELLSLGRMTDDSKEATKHPTPNGIQFNTDGMTDDSKEARRLQSFSSMNLDGNKLMLLAAVCKCPAAIHQLMTCGLPAMLAQAVCEFCNQQILLMATLSATSESLSGGDTAGLNGFISESHITATLVSEILRFFTDISSETELKDWLGKAEGNAFWSLLLTLLCGSQCQTPVMLNSTNSDAPGLLSAEERCELETRTIEFFSTVISYHTENQLLFAKVLCEVIKDQGTSKTDLASAMPLSGFMRRLLLQVLLEDERITVAVRNTSSMIPNDDEPLSNDGTESFPLAGCAGQIFHPRYGSGRGCQCVTMNLNAKCSDVISKVADSLPMSSSFSDKKDDKKKRADEGNKKEAVVEEEEDIMDFLSRLAASAKEKREKSPATTATVTAASGLPPRPPTRRGRLTQGADSLLESVGSLRMPQALYRARLRHIRLPGKDLPHNLTLSQLLHVLSDYALLPPTLALQFLVRYRSPGSLSFKDGINDTFVSDEVLLSATPFPSALKMFASVGGLALLAEHLPLLFPEISRQTNNVEVVSDASSVCDISADWVTVESSDEFYDPYLEPLTPPHVAKTSKNAANGTVPSIPPHSLIAFGLFLRLPGYADVLLKERKMAQCLLRLVLGVTDDGDGGQILTSPAASLLPTMPFTVLKTLFDSSPLTTDDGVLLRRMALDIGVVHLVLACLATLSHHKPRVPLSSFQHETQLILTAMQSSSAMASLSQPEEKSQQHYWAKGTGFGTGSTTSSWDAEQAMLRQKGEEEHVACLLQVLASYMNPNTSFEMNRLTSTPKTTTEARSTAASKSGVGMGMSAFSASDSDSPSTPPSSPSQGDPSTSADTPSSAGHTNAIPDSLVELLSQSCLVPALSSYLRNDSVLDMARHVPLYRALLQLLRGITSNPALVPILLPMEVAGHAGLGLEKDSFSVAGEGAVESQACIETLLEKMKGCVDTYASRLKSNKGKSTNKMEDEESEGLALLIPDIQETARLVGVATQRFKEMNEQSSKQNKQESQTNSAKPQRTLEHKYLSAMKELQFDTYEMVTEEGKTFKFHVSHHYESNVKATGTVSNVARTRRLAQEAVTLSTSLPLAFSSSVFVRCDEERLDVMKVLITGPADTPYANGCFEFDVFFPHDYPNTPPFINMETTGNHSVRFNPNLYNDGKVCLSILNTWHGRPEEKWNAQTSSFLQVLVSIQSLILVSEPYFNEPGYERSRGTPPGQASSHEYDANIRQATVKWAMLEQLKNPSACFKEIIHTHFWLKRNEIMQQCETWMAEMEGYSNDKRTGRSIAQSNSLLKRHYNHLREELSWLKPPPDLEEEDKEQDAPAPAPAPQASTSGSDQAQALPLQKKQDQEGAASVSAVSAMPDINSMIEQPLLSEDLFSKQEELFENDSQEEDSPFMYLDGGSLFNSSLLPPDSPFTSFPDDMSFDTDPEC